MPQKVFNPFVESIRAMLTPEAIKSGREIYLEGAIREFRADLRRRRYTAVIQEKEGASVSIRIQAHKGEAEYECSVHGKSNPQCAHVAALITAIREHEAIQGDGAKAQKSGSQPVPLVEYLLETADRDQLAKTLRLGMKAFPEMQGDLIFTALESGDEDGSLYETVVGLMLNSKTPSEYTLPEEGMDIGRLEDELFYLFEQKLFKQVYLLGRAVLSTIVSEKYIVEQLDDQQFDLLLSAASLLAELVEQPEGEEYFEQVHELAYRLLQRHPDAEPQVQGGLVALLQGELMSEEQLEALEASLISRWDREKKPKRRKRDRAQIEVYAMPIALLYAKTMQYGKLETLFEEELQHPLLRAPALAEMIMHGLHEVVIDYVEVALVPPPASTQKYDQEDISRCMAYGELVTSIYEELEDDGRAISLLKNAFHSIGYRYLNIVDQLREALPWEEFQAFADETVASLMTQLPKGGYPAATKVFQLLCEVGKFDEARAHFQRFRQKVDLLAAAQHVQGLITESDASLLKPFQQVLGDMLQGEEVDPALFSLLEHLMAVAPEQTESTLESNYFRIVNDRIAEIVDLMLMDDEDFEFED